MAGQLAFSGRQARHIPIARNPFTGPAEPVMKPESPIGPKLNLKRLDPIPPPERRAGRVGTMARPFKGNARHQCSPALQRLRLLRRPSPKPAFQGTTAKIGVRIRAIFTRNNPTHPYLPSKRFPVKHKSRPAGAFNLFCLHALVIGIKNEGIAFDRLQQYHTHIRHAIFIDCGKSHSVRIVQLLHAGLVQPVACNVKRVIPRKMSLSFHHGSPLVEGATCPGDFYLSRHTFRQV